MGGWGLFALQSAFLIPMFYCFSCAKKSRIRKDVKIINYFPGYIVQKSLEFNTYISLYHHFTIIYHNFIIILSLIYHYFYHYIIIIIITSFFIHMYFISCPPKPHVQCTTHTKNHIHTVYIHFIHMFRSYYTRSRHLYRL